MLPAAGALGGDGEAAAAAEGRQERGVLAAEGSGVLLMGGEDAAQLQTEGVRQELMRGTAVTHEQTNPLL